MTIQKYMEQLKDIAINTSAVKDIEDRYRIKCPEPLKRLISNAKESVFLDHEIRILSLKEILNAPVNLHVDFIRLGIIPFADCYDNDFAVYCRNGEWALFNIVDQCKFNETSEWEKLFVS